MGETRHIPVANYEDALCENRTLAIQCQECGEKLTTDWLNDYFHRSSRFETALQDLITIIELEEIDLNLEPMLMIAAREKALLNAKELLPEVYSEPYYYTPETRKLP